MNIRILLALMITITAQSQIYDTNGDFVQTFAGFGIPGYIDGQGQSSEFNNPSQIVSDTSGNLYVWDNARLRKITPEGTVTTFAGGGNLVEGYGTNVSFSFYSSIGTFRVDRNNVIWLPVTYFSETYLLCIQTNGYIFVQNGGITNFSTSSGYCFDSQNNIYYSGGNRIWKYNPNTFISQSVVGSGVPGHLDGIGIFSELGNYSALVCDQADNIYFIDAGLRKVDQFQNVTTITNYPYTGNLIQVDNNGNILTINPNSSVPYEAYICRLTLQTNVVFYAGNPNFTGIGTYTNGQGNLARFNNPLSACFCGGSIFVADAGNNRIRQISFNPTSQLVASPNLQLKTYAGIQINGLVGRTYQIQSSANMGTWTTKAAVILPTSPYLWIDPTPLSGNVFYRAFLMP